jgi:hypothetical protein
MSYKSKKENLIQKYEMELARMMSDGDIERYLGPHTVIKYSDLVNYKNINELLPNDTDFKVILTEQELNSGHWCCLLKYKNIIEWFDSYGMRPDGQFTYINNITKHLLGQGGNPLTKLLKNGKRKDQKVFYNKRRFQVTDNNINTCGRWCVARILAMRVGYELDDFIEKVDDKMAETKKPSDVLVVDWIPF